MAQLDWWTPVPWLIGAFAIGVSIYAFRRNRHPSVAVLRMATDCLAKFPEWDYHDYLTVELTCRGADIYDFELFLECTHLYWYRTGKVFSWRLGSVTRRYQFEPKQPLPNPFKNGQVIALVLPDHHFRNLRDRKIVDPRTPSQLWPRSVRLVAYHAGKRRLLSISSWRFWRLLRSFDYLCRHPERAASLSGNETLHRESTLS
jgi:hypothetical protein